MFSKTYRSNGGVPPPRGGSDLACLSDDRLPRALAIDTSLTLRRGFTLVELLVVMAIIALLMALLAPSLGAARQQAKQVMCACRLKQWGVAFNCYEAENRGVWPHCDGLDRGPRELDDPFVTPEDEADWHGWTDMLPPMLNLKPWREHPRFHRPDDKTFFQCPTGMPLEGNGIYSYRPFRDGYFSYAMNSCLELDANAWPPDDGIGYPMESFLATSKIVRPPRVILLYDQLLDPRKGFDEKKMYKGAGKYSATYPKSFAARHRHGRSGLGGNILFCDGHVGWKQTVWKEEWIPELEVPPRDDPDWYPYPPAPGAEPDEDAVIHREGDEYD
ncbi:MAG: prepilin-type N-terminal cleavage/methylation domain-containing protein [Phycisphaerae bacterium]|jgi:prepilin-type N-terminal cleavage/methylation domain-containing protein/prepilin-type processing-associated H-X9-DG protein